MDINKRLEEFIRTKHERLVGFIKQQIFSVPLDPEDLAQDVYIQALRKIHQLRDPEKFESWLMSIAFRLTLNAIISYNLHRPTQIDVVGEQSCRKTHQTSTLDPAEIAENKDTANYFASTLKPHFRGVIEDFYFLGLNIYEIAAKRKVPLGTVKQRLFKGRKLMKEKAQKC